MDGGSIIARALGNQHVRHLFALCGGHISPILVGAKQHGIRVIDVRDEATAVFAADAEARLTGIPGVAAVTAGPGVTNTITAIKNAQMAQSPLVLLGGATATILENRGSLQDIDQESLMRPHVKDVFRMRSVRQLAPAIEEAFELARADVPGPVFSEVPVDLLYDEATVREWYFKESGADKMGGVTGMALKAYLGQHLGRQFWGAPGPVPRTPQPFHPAQPATKDVDQVARWLAEAERPAFVLGSGTVTWPRDARRIADAVDELGVPTCLGGMARGLLGHRPEIQFRHKRSKALREADLVVVAGFPLDFRLGYGQSINRKARLVTVGIDRAALSKNRRPTLGIHADAGAFLRQLASSRPDVGARWAPWFDTLREREDARDAEIVEQSGADNTNVNPLHFFRRLEEPLPDDSILVVDGGDFVATGSYILRPRRPLSWLDPGVFGTLGVGGGFALAGKLVRPEAETWLIWGDGSSAYSLAELDTYARHGLPVIAVVGNDGSWSQIARDQVEILGDDVGTCLVRNDYHRIAEGWGAHGILLDNPDRVDGAIAEAQAVARGGRPVLINLHIGKTEFRKGSISM